MAGLAQQAVKYGVPAGMSALTAVGGYQMLPEAAQEWLKSLGKQTGRKAGEGAGSAVQTLLTGNPNFVRDLQDEVARQGTLSKMEDQAFRRKEHTDLVAELTQRRAERKAQKAAPPAPAEPAVKPAVTLDPRILAGLGGGSALVLGAAWAYKRHRIAKLREQAAAGNAQAIRELARRGELI